MENSDPLPTHWTLIHRLRDWDDQESWREFIETYWRLLQMEVRKLESQQAVTST